MPPLLLAQSNKIPPRSCILRRSLRTFVGEELAPPSSLPVNKTSPLTRAPAGNNPINASDSIVFPLPDSPTNPTHSPAPISSDTPFTGRTHPAAVGIVATILSIAKKKE
jgi:hypothetical protein